MVTLNGLKRTLAATRDFQNLLSIKLSKKKRPITFRNGVTLRLTWPEFRILRDNYQLLKKYTFEQMGEDLFKIRNEKLEYTGPLLDVCIRGGVGLCYTVRQVGKDLFKIKDEHFELEGTSSMLYVVWELGQGDYDIDCQGKVVLDVGGFQGETAAFFWKMGAKKIIIYEPVKAHHKFIKKNISVNRINAEIHEQGIGNVDGTQVVHYNATGTTFGDDEGECEMEIQIRNVASVIEENGADIAKFDCEGAEESLVQVSNEVLRKIAFYTIEVHSTEIRKAIIKKFREAGFNLGKKTAKSGQITVLHFKRKKNSG